MGGWVMPRFIRAAFTSCPPRGPPGLIWATGLPGIPHPFLMVAYSPPLQVSSAPGGPGAWPGAGMEGPEGLEALRPVMGGERGQLPPDPTSEARPHPAGRLRAPAPGLQEHPQSSQITGPACRPPGSRPLQRTHRQIALKIDLGWPGVAGLGGGPPHPLPFPRLGPAAPLR